MRHVRRIFPFAVLFGLLSLPLALLLPSDSDPAVERRETRSDTRRAYSPSQGDPSHAHADSGFQPEAGPRPGLTEVDVRASGASSTNHGALPPSARPAKVEPSKTSTPTPSWLERQAMLDAADAPKRAPDALALADLEDARLSADLPPILAPLAPQPGASVGPAAHQHDAVLRAATGYGKRGELGFGVVELLSNRAPGPTGVTFRYAWDPSFELDHFELGKNVIEAQKQVSLVAAERGMAVFQIVGGQRELSSGELLKVWFRIPEEAVSGTELRVEIVHLDLEQATTNEINDSMILE